MIKILGICSGKHRWGFCSIFQNKIYFDFLVNFQKCVVFRARTLTLNSCDCNFSRSMAMSSTDRLLEKAKSMSEPQALQNLEEFHSNYVPAELERQLEFLDFNSGEQQPTLLATTYVKMFEGYIIWVITDLNFT